MTSTFKISIVGGSGPQGKALAYRFAKAGHTVALGSRSADRSQAAAEEVNNRLEGSGNVNGMENSDSLQGADVVLLAVPYEGHAELVTSLAGDLAGKVVISCVNPLGFDKRGPYGLDVPESAAEEAQRLAPGAAVVGAFHHLSAPNLWGPAPFLDHEDVLVCGDDAEAKSTAIELARAVTGRDGIDAGALRLARQLEPLTAVLISINKRYKTRSGVQITGVSA
ncbi:NADPH-dependent F420 reductase [Arthrobacter sp. I2-34]|uniref:NADPH-dependent F420 reductase n=1 Tax=Arthrobacter hankyongi TaxID=2904801 RepID=A0ABS9L9U3_9MICC|nr:NADPH-dependent F420 reductase [Arthrobacter hankyongi]MCG2623449.1 NADPH-dependent F420 reductase [Arthrobacter hankyongi]